MESEKNRGGLPVEWVEVKEVEEVEQAGLLQAGVQQAEVEQAGVQQAGVEEVLGLVVRQALCEGGGGNCVQNVHYNSITKQQLLYVTHLSPLSARSWSCVGTTFLR